MNAIEYELFFKMSVMVSTSELKDNQFEQILKALVRKHRINDRFHFRGAVALKFKTTPVLVGLR